MKDVEVISPLAAILIVTLSFFLLVFIGSGVTILLGYEVGLILAELLVVIVPLGYMLYRRVNVRSYVGLEVTPKNILIGAALGALLFLVDIVASNILVSIFGVSKAVEESNTLIINLSHSPQGLIAIIASLVLAGICEEFTFRGFLQNAIGRRYSVWPALLVSSLAFGLFHFDPQLVYIISAFISGLLLGYVYHRWHSYVISAVAHLTVNLIVLAVLMTV